jgi:hypothetical protein
MYWSLAGRFEHDLVGELIGIARAFRVGFRHDPSMAGLHERSSIQIFKLTHYPISVEPILQLIARRADMS